MKKILLMLFVATSALYANACPLVISDEVIAMGDAIIKLVCRQAQEQASTPLTGTLPDLYAQLANEGYRAYMAAHPEAVAKAAEYMNFLTDKESVHDDVKAAVEAFDAACALPKGTDIQTVAVAWLNELRAFNSALQNIVHNDASKELVRCSFHEHYILENNGKIFKDEETLVALGGGALAIFAGFERRKNAMPEEVFNVLFGNWPY